MLINTSCHVSVTATTRLSGLPALADRHCHIAQQFLFQAWRHRSKVDRGLYGRYGIGGREFATK